MIREVYPCLWFDGRAKEAAVFYCSIFPNSRITSESPMVVNWELNGKQFMGLNDRRPQDHFNETISFVITCDTQQEIDHYWSHLTADGGTESMCGWCRDKFGVSWQVVPAVLRELMSDPARAPRAIQAFLKMKKFDIEKLMKA